MIMMAAEDALWTGDTSDLTAAMAAGFEPDPSMTVDEWAAARRELTTEDTPREYAGRWDNSRLPWAVGIMRALSPTAQHWTGAGDGGRLVNPRRVVYKASSQASKTAIGLNFIGRSLECSPQPMLIVQPTQSAARKFSRQRIDPMIKACPELKSRVREGKGREAGNSSYEKLFDGGALFIAWAGSAHELASMPVGLVWNDEFAKYPEDAGGQGDAKGQSEQRAQNFPNAKIFNSSTCTSEGFCSATSEYQSGDQCKWLVPCPDCGVRQDLVWESVRWDKEAAGGEIVHRAETAHYVCVHCGSCWSDQQRWAAVRKGEWASHAEYVDTASFEIWSIHLPPAWMTMEALVRDWLAVRHDPKERKRFVILKLGRPYRQPGAKVSPDSLQSRAEDWRDAAGRRIEVPHGVGLLTAFVDVQERQGGFLELNVIGWGAGEESWRILHQRIYGAIDQPHVWAQLEAFRTRIWRHASGAPLRIAMMGVDSGYKRNAVYEFVAPRQDSVVRTRATKGGPTEQREPFKMSKSKNEQGVNLVLVGTVAMKDDIFPRLMMGVENRGGADALRGYMHFRVQDDPNWPPEERWHNGADKDYYRQFAAEKRVWDGNRYVYVNPAHEPNEAIDLEVGNLTMLHVLLPKATRDATLSRYAADLSAWRPKEQSVAAGQQVRRGGRPRKVGGIRT